MSQSRWMVLLVSTLTALPLATEARADRVERRGIERSIDGDISRIDDAGILVRSSTGAEHFVPWDRVRAIDPPPRHPRFDEWMELATDLWRARSRVERYDTALAEPLLERLAERFAGATHETALVVAEGLLRCRLARGAHAAAIVPALETARLRRAGVTTTSYDALGAVIDLDTWLCPALAPVWLDTPALVRMRRELAGWDAGGDELVESLARLYHAAASVAGGVADVPVPAGVDAPGVAILRDTVRALAPSGAERDAGRAAMTARFEDGRDWVQAWARLGVGFAMLGDVDRLDRQRGMVHLLHLPARHARSQPFLAGLAMALVAEAMAAAGDTVHAESLRREISTTFPAHPVGTWPVAGTSRIRSHARAPQTAKEFG